MYLEREYRERSWGAAPSRAREAFADPCARAGWGGALLGRTPRVGRLVAAYPADVAIVAMSYLVPTAHALVGELERQATPAVFYGERPSPLHRGPKRLVRDAVAARLLRRCRGVVGITRETAAWYRERFRPDLPSDWMPYHRDLGTFAARRRGDAAPGEPLRAVILGSLVPRKDVGCALRAAALAGAGHVSLTVAGDGPQRRALERLAGRLQAPVSFRGHVEFADVPSVLLEHDVLVIPSLNDGFGMAVVEALATGAPVIASREVMSAREYLEDWRNGVLVAPGDVHGVARAMTALAGDRTLLARMSEQARRSIAAAYDADADGARLASFLRRVASGGVGRA